MKQLIKLHIGLYRFLNRELPKIKTLKGLIKFLKPITLAYLGELLRLYKNVYLVFDKEYQKNKKQFDKTQKIKADLNRALKILQYIDKRMVQQGKNRQYIRQFWRDFYSERQVREDVFNELFKEIR